MRIKKPSEDDIPSQKTFVYKDHKIDSFFTTTPHREVGLNVYAGYANMMFAVTYSSNKAVVYKLRSLGFCSMVINGVNVKQVHVWEIS
jgi:hypothetical protein